MEEVIELRDIPKVGCLSGCQVLVPELSEGIPFLTHLHITLLVCTLCALVNEAAISAAD